MDRFESMSAFVAVVEAGGFSAASRRLGMPLASLSRKVSELEEQLGVRLLARSTRNVTVTDSGRQYYEACRRILADLGEADRAASGEYSAPRGDLIMTAPIVFGRIHIIPIVVDFLKAYPDVNMHVLLADHVINLMEDHIDVALRIGALPDSSLVAVRVGRVGRVACASPAYLEQRGTPLHPQDLAAHDCVTFGSFGSTAEWTFRVGTADTKVPVRSRLTVTTAEAAVDAAVAGVGITRVLSYQAEEAVRDGRLVAVLRGFEPATSPVHLVHAGGRFLPLKLRAYLDFAVPRLKSRLQTMAGSLVAQD